MAGLDAVKKVKKYDEGGEVQGGTTPGLQATINPKSGQVNPVNKIALDKGSSDKMMANLQSMIDERQGFMNSLLRGGMLASAFGMPASARASALPAAFAANQQYDKDTEGMQERMIGLQAARNAQEQYEQNRDSMFGLGGAGGIGGGMGGAGGPPPVIAQAIRNAPTPDEAKKIFNTWAQKSAEQEQAAMLNPAAYKQELRFENGVEKPMDMWQIRAQQMAGAGPYAPKRPAPVQGAAQSAGDIAQAIFAQESTSGKADTSKFNEYGVTGPMQIMDTTFKHYQDKGVIPRNYNISNPEHNLEAGKMIVNDIANKHGGDTEKIAAEYYGGPGAINSDGSIKRDRRPKNGGPTVGEYVDSIKSKLGGEQKATDRSYQDFKRQQKIEDAKVEAASKAREKEAEDAGTFIAGVEKQAAGAKEIEGAAERVLKHAKEHPEEFGLAEKGGVAGAILSAPGVVPYVGEHAAKGMEKLYATTLGKDANVRRNKTNNDAAKLGLDFAKQTFAGSGARLGLGLVDMAQKAKGVGTEHTAESNILNATLIDIAAKKSQKQAAAWTQFKDENPKATAYDFIQSKVNKQIEADMDADLRRRLPKEVAELEGGSAPSRTYEDADKERRYQEFLKKKKG
jgi:soluble lytic murein transglycosylase-like protein